MFLSPVEIQHQQLGGRRRTYRREDVDRLLENVAASYEQVWLERDQRRARVDELEREIADYRDMERHLRDGVVAAHRAAEEMRTDAGRESEAALGEARRQAEEIVAEAKRERDRLADDIRRLETLERETFERYRGLLVAVLDVLERHRPATEPPAPKKDVDTEPALEAVVVAEDQSRADSAADLGDGPVGEDLRAALQDVLPTREERSSDEPEETDEDEEPIVAAEAEVDASEDEPDSVFEEWSPRRRTGARSRRRRDG